MCVSPVVFGSREHYPRIAHLTRAKGHERQGVWPVTSDVTPPMIARRYLCDITGVETKRPRREYQQGRKVRERQQGVGVWRRDGRDCEHPCAPGPVPLVMRLPNSAEPRSVRGLRLPAR
jgi:hypothetical protein